MSDLAIQTKGLSKLYRIGVVEKYPTIRESLMRAASIPLRALKSLALAGNNVSGAGSMWALRDVDFDVKHGEVLGIIGRNGAGKSTLLKILTGITEPTKGYADIHGRVGSLLEVGTGFHMELTGRENIFMNGALLGMRRQEIKRKFDEIVVFAETEKFLDTPVKRYSSGMYMRLAFAVAAHLDPEILMVDEVLAVGDAAFQKKCLGKMGSIAQQGRTVLFVSHNMATIQALCQKAVWIEGGQVKAIGPAPEVVSQYQESVTSMETIQVGKRTDRLGDGSVKIHSIRIQALDEAPVIRMGSCLKVIIEYASAKLVLQPQVYVSIYDLSHRGIYALDSDIVGGLPEVLPPRGTLTCVTHAIHLTPGRCYMNAGFSKGGALADRVEYAAYFDVEAEDFYGTGKMPERSWVLGVLRHRWLVDEKIQEAL